MQLHCTAKCLTGARPCPQHATRASPTLRGPAPSCPAGLYSFCKALETLETGVLGGFFFKVNLGVGAA